MPLRVHVTGNAGAGKSTFARRLAAITGAPLFHLDSVVWTMEWRKARRKDRLHAERAWLAEDVWIIEGVSARAREVSDLVIWLDVPEAICLRRARLRCARLRSRVRSEMPRRCPEIAIRARLPAIVRGFRPVARRLRRAALEAPERVLRIRTPAEGGRILAAFEAGAFACGTRIRPPSFERAHRH